jgi:hypothetical protein
MGNSSISLQKIIDSASTIGDLRPVLVNTGGFSSEPALTIGNDVVADMFSPRFPWKWNRIKLPAFPTITRQQDYASLDQHNIGWLENAFRIDANSTQVPPLTWPIRVVRDLPVMAVGAGWPRVLCWLPNNQLEQWPWPGPNKTYTNPVGTVQTPSNPPTNILDANGNILVLTKWGTTGLVPPLAPEAPDPDDPPADWNAPWPIGAVIQDGTCEWTVAHPTAQGIRLAPPPPDTSGNTWLIRIFAQGGGPYFTTLQDSLDPIPNEDAKYFREGFVAYAHRYSANPVVKNRYMELKREWQSDLQGNLAQGANEEDYYGFYPAHGLLSPEYFSDPGPGNPYWRQWGGR